MQALTEGGCVAGKPVIVGEFGSQRPMAARNAIYAAGTTPSWAVCQAPLSQGKHSQGFELQQVFPFP